MTVETVDQADALTRENRPSPLRGGPARKRDLAILFALVALAGVIAALLTPGRSPSVRLAGDASSSQTSLFAGATLSPVSRAPLLSLRSYTGEAVNIDHYRGKAVFVTFLYTSCPDVCPIITSNLRVAQNLMSPSDAAKVQLIAVSVDPRGDTRAAVAAFLARHEMTGRMQYLIGSTRELASVWRAWNVGSERDAGQPQFVNHTGLVYGISASGMLRTVYPANFKPGDIAHDAAKLLAE